MGGVELRGTEDNIFRQVGRGSDSEGTLTYYLSGSAQEFGIGFAHARR